MYGVPAMEVPFGVRKMEIKILPLLPQKLKNWDFKLEISRKFYSS